MSKINFRLFVLVALAITMMVAALPVSAAGSATLEANSTSQVLNFTVSAGGQYVLHLEGNQPSEYLKANASGGKVSFTLPVNKKYWQLENIVPTNKSNVWVKTTDDGWFGLTAAPAQGGNDPFAIVKDGEILDGTWRVEKAKQNLVWVGPEDGSIDIRQNGLSLDLIRAGWTSTFNYTVPFRVEICYGAFHGNTVQTYTDCGDNGRDLFAAGQYTVDQTKAPNGGFRIYPEEGYGWRAGQPAKIIGYPDSTDTRRLAPQLTLGTWLTANWLVLLLALLVALIIAAVIIIARRRQQPATPPADS